MKIPIYNISGKDTGKEIQLEEHIFGLKPNEHAVYLDVKRYLAGQRQGTHKSKERGEIVGSTRKIKKQKGTGTARAGSIKNPIFRGGGRTFGPQPRDYTLQLNKKVKKTARKSALSDKAKKQAIIVLEDFKLENPKTKELLTIKKNLKLENEKLLFILAEEDKNIYLASKNLKKTFITKASDINTYQIMNSEKIIFAESSLKKIEEIFKN